MALNDAQFVTNLKLAFAEVTWAGCADKLATAVDTYVLTGTVNTTVTGVVTPPIPATPYPATGVGVGSVVPPSKTLMVPNFITAFASIVWVTVGTLVATGINTYLIASIASTTDSAILIGSGTGPVVPTGLAVLTTSLTTAFTTSGPTSSWDLLSTDIKNAVKLFITTSIITTADAGVVPPNAWVGTGTGTIS